MLFFLLIYLFSFGEPLQNRGEISLQVEVMSRNFRIPSTYHLTLSQTLSYRSEMGMIFYPSPIIKDIEYKLITAKHIAQENWGVFIFIMT